MAKHAFIIGGTGQVGLAVALRLLRNGWTVDVVSRGQSAIPLALRQAGARPIVCDRAQAGALASALQGGADLLLDVLSFDALDAAQLLAVQNNVGAIVALSSISVYTDGDAGRTLDEAAQTGFPEFPLPVLETQATVKPDPATYSTRKVAMEQTLLDGATVPAAVLRPGAIYGPYSHHPREWWFVKRLLDGRKAIPLAYRGLSRFQPSSVENIAALVEVVSRAKFSGILNAVDADCPTVSDIGQMIMRATDLTAEMVPVESDHFPPIAGGNPWGVPKPFVVSDSAARSIGYSPDTNYGAAVVAACQWLVENASGDWRQKFPVLAAYPWNLFDYAAEDVWLAARPTGEG